MTTTRAALAAEIAATHDMDERAAEQAVDIYAEQLGAAYDADLSDEDADHIRRAVESQQAVDSGAPLDLVAEATETKRLADEAATDADREWRKAIGHALARGQRVVDIAEAAGVSRERVYQIRDGRR